MPTDYPRTFKANGYGPSFVARAPGDRLGPLTEPELLEGYGVLAPATPRARATAPVGALDPARSVRTALDRLDEISTLLAAVRPGDAA